MLTFRTPDNLNYTFFAYIQDKEYNIYGTWNDGLRNRHSFMHERQKSHLSLEDYCRSKYPQINAFQQTDLEPGVYYPRIWRGIWSPQNILAPVNAITSSVVACSLLVSRLLNIFRIVEPTPDNVGAYGHEIRDLLLLACMEVESSLAAVLKAHGYTKTRPNTKDYVKLKDLMWLEYYTVRLLSYPDFPIFSPFASWDSTDSSVSLIWWVAYNKVKHNREKNFSLSTLESAIHAIGAAVILLYAQFGEESKGTSIGVDITSEFELNFSSMPPD